MLRVYHVHGIRHQAVVFAESPDQAVAQALAQELAGDWEYPEAIEVPLPRGYRIVYDPAFIPAKQAELPIAVDKPAPEPPFVLTRSGVKVYEEWRDNIVVDADAPAIVWKANRDLFARNTTVPGRPRLASKNNEDALCWNLFHTLEKIERLDAVTRPLGIDDEYQVLYWHRPWDAAEPLPQIDAALHQIEPWRKVGKRFPTETRIMLKGQRHLVMVEATLGKPGAQMRPWERARNALISEAFEEPLRDLLESMTDWQGTMRRYYRLLRPLILASELGKREAWNLQPHLLVIVNALNRQHSLRSHEYEFGRFQGYLRLPPERTHLVIWQALLERAKASFEPGVRPLLTHAAKLSYLQLPENAPGWVRY